MKISNDEKRITLQREQERQRKEMQKTEQLRKPVNEKKPPSSRR